MRLSSINLIASMFLKGAIQDIQPNTQYDLQSLHKRADPVDSFAYMTLLDSYKW